MTPRIRLAAVWLAGALVLTVSASHPAVAEDGGGGYCAGFTCYSSETVTTGGAGSGGAGGGNGGHAGSHRKAGKHKLTAFERQVAAIRAENAHRIAISQRARAATAHCVAALSAAGANCPTTVTKVHLINLPTLATTGNKKAAPVAPALTPEQAAYAAVADLTLPTNPPGIGPPPNINRWKMAVVGYPLWLWSDGPTHLGPVTTNVLDASVSLDATLTQTTFRTGDGGLVRCTGAGTPWTTTITPGSPSPSCGYRYQRPSLPTHRYTVTAYTTWSVHWTAGNQAGVIDVPIATTTQLPVGELQAVIR